MFRSQDNQNESRFYYTDTINFGNHTWTIAFYAPENFGLDVFRRQTPFVILIVGAIFSLLLFIILYIVFSQRDRALKIAHEMTKDLSKVTLEAQERANEAEKLNRLMVDRELKMIDLKKELKRKRKSK